MGKRVVVRAPSCQKTVSLLLGTVSLIPKTEKIGCHTADLLLADTETVPGQQSNHTGFTTGAPVSK